MWRDHWRALVQRVRFALTPKKQRRWMVAARSHPELAWRGVDNTYGRDYTRHNGMTVFTQANAEFIAFKMARLGLDTTTMRVI